MLPPSIPIESSTGESSTGDPGSIESSHPVGQRDLCLRQLFDSLETPLLRYAFSMLRRREVAEEIVQEVFMKLHVHWETVENPQAWLYRSVRNGVLGYLRKNKAELPPGSAAQLLVEQLASDGTTAAESFANSRPSNHEHRSNHSALGNDAEGETASSESHQGSETMSHPSAAKDSASGKSSPVAVLAMASLQPQQCPQAISQRIEACELLREAIDQLEAKDQEIVRLKYFEGMKYREISERTGLSIGNVGYRLHNILTSLANRLRPLGIDGA